MYRVVATRNPGVRFAIEWERKFPTLEAAIGNIEHNMHDDAPMYHGGNVEEWLYEISDGDLKYRIVTPEGIRL